MTRREAYTFLLKIIGIFTVGITMLSLLFWLSSLSPAFGGLMFALLLVGVVELALYLERKGRP